MTFNMKGSPAKLGTIQGTAGHASALKQKAKTYDEAFVDNLDYQDDEGEGAEHTRTQNYGKKDQWGRKYEGSNVKGVKGGQSQEDVDEHKKANPDTKMKVGDYKSGKYDHEADDRGKADFKKAAKAWNMKTYGTTEPTRDAKKGGMTKKELAAQYKASKTTVEPAKTETPVTTDKPTEKTKVLESKTFVPKKKGLGAKKGKTLSMADKSTEKAAIATQKTKIKTAKKSGDKTGRDEGQLEKAQIKSGRDNKYTGTRLSRYLAKLKVKRNKRQLKNRKTETTE